jgi:hypothetical protein
MNGSMANTTNDIWNDNDGEEEQPKKRRGRGVLVFLLILMIVLGIVLVAAYRDGTGFDALRRYFSYGTTESVTGETVYQYDTSSSNRFVMLDNCLVVLSGTRLQVLDAKGSEVWSASVSMSSPALSQGGGRAVAYDIGGTALYVVDQNGEVALKDQNGETITWADDVGDTLIAATLNEKGCLAVTAEKTNYKGAVSVFNADLQLVFAFNSSQRFVSDAYVTDDGGTLAAVTLGQENSVFVSNIVLYDLTKEDPTGSYSVSDGLALAIGQQGGKLVTVTDTCLTFADTDGTDAVSYSYNGGYLREYDFQGDDFTALLLNRYQSGSVGRLVTVGTDGEEIGTLDVNREVLGISAAGRYLAVLYADSLVLYNRELQVYASLNGTESVTGVLMRSDGSAVMLSSNSASLFLP